jgi:hypothetical protein
MSSPDSRVLQRIREHAYSSLDPNKISHTNLVLDRRVWREGEQLGPGFQGLAVGQPSVVVFVDEEPRANFGHSCQYLLYDPATARPLAALPARFPPWTVPSRESLDEFHIPIPPVSNGTQFHVRLPFRCPVFWPRGNRYAIFYSGMTFTRHLNDMEFGYRTLVHRYGFDPGNITVLSYDGSTDTTDSSYDTFTNSTWPGDGTPYQIQVNGQGNQSAFEAAVDALKPKLDSDDLLFIHTNNHGDNNGMESFLCEYNSWDSTYLASDFAAKLAELPEYGSLIVMMEQCNSGGFIAPILASSSAGATSVACAATASDSSWSTNDGNWDAFAYQWFAAQAGGYPSGAALAFNPDTNGDGKIEATEAYAYASLEDRTADTPQYGQSSAAGGDISLGQEYVIWWWWCWLLREALEPRYLELPENEYYEQLRKMEPRLRELIGAIDLRSDELRVEVASRIAEIVGR